jgi:hypothetical protein
VELAPAQAAVKDAGRVKGLSIAELVKGIRETQGPEGLLRIVERIPPTWRRHFDPTRVNLGILASTWYPSEVINCLYDLLIENLSPQQRRALADEIGRGYVDRLLRGVYKIIFDVLMTPERYVVHAQRLWNQGCDTGKLSLTLVDSRRVEGGMADWRGHHPFGCEVSHMIGLHIFRAMGCNDVTSVLLCRQHTGTNACIGSYSWTSRS